MGTRAIKDKTTSRNRQKEQSLVAKDRRKRTVKKGKKAETISYFLHYMLCSVYNYNYNSIIILKCKQIYNYLRLYMKRFVCLIAAAAMAAAISSEAKTLKVLYWNIQNGMWCGQYDNYDSFVGWVSAQEPDICIWCEGQTIYYTGTYDAMKKDERYLVGNWDELASRYGHKYIYVGGHRDNYPQVITSRYPITNVERITGDESQTVSHGAGWATIEVDGNVINIVTVHTWPQKYSFTAASGSKEEREALLTFINSL